MSPSVYIIGIAGGTASGKTTFADNLLNTLSAYRPALISLDSYYHNQDHLTPDERINTNYDHPNAFDLDLLIQNLNQLKSGLPTEVPIYNFSTHTRAKNTQSIAPTNLIIVEGILTLHYWEIREALNWKIFISASDQVRLNRRINRDRIERNRSEDEVLRQWQETVVPMHQQYCEATKIFANHIVSGETLDLYQNKEDNEIIVQAIKNFAEKIPKIDLN